MFSETQRRGGNVGEIVLEGWARALVFNLQASQACLLASNKMGPGLQREVNTVSVVLLGDPQKNALFYPCHPLNHPVPNAPSLQHLGQCLASKLWAKRTKGGLAAMQMSDVAGGSPLAPATQSQSSELPSWTTVSGSPSRISQV